MNAGTSSLRAAESVNHGLRVCEGSNTKVLASLTSFFFRQRMADEDIAGRRDAVTWAAAREYWRAARAQARRYVYGR